MATIRVGVEYGQAELDKGYEIVRIVSGLSDYLGSEDLAKITKEFSLFLDVMQKALDEESRLNS